MLIDEKTLQNFINQVCVASNLNEANYQAFLGMIFKDIVEEDVADLDVQEMAMESFEFYKFFQNFDLGPCKVRVFNQDHNNIIIETINRDMPFILDSILEELNKYNVKIKEIFHPIVRATRDEAGKLLSIGDTENYQLESVIRIKTSIISSDKIKVLEQKLAKILSNVKLVVSDWKKMTSNLEQTLEYAWRNVSSDKTEEVKDFLTWLNENFTFIGYNKFIFENNKAKLGENSTLGIVSEKDNNLNDIILRDIVEIFAKNNSNFINIGKLDYKSPVHRNINLDYISVKHFDEKKQIDYIEVYIGLFATKIYYQSVLTIPIIKRRVAAILAKSGYAKSSYNGKELISILESMPRDELFRIDEDLLFEMVMKLLDMLVHPKPKLFIYSGNSSSFISSIIFLPQDILDSRKIEKMVQILHNNIGGEIENYYMQVSGLRLAYVHITIKADAKILSNLNIKKIEEELKEIAKSWEDDLENYLLTNGNSDLVNKYKNLFQLSYQEKYTDKSSVLADINLIEKVLAGDDVIFDLQKKSDSEYELKVFNSGKQIYLAKIMPVITNLGFDVLDQQAFQINMSDEKIWINSFHLEHFSISGDFANIKSNAEEALKEVYLEKVKDSSLNKLVVTTNLNIRQVTLIRALTKYMRQVGSTYGLGYTESVLNKHPKLTNLFVELFYNYLSPDRNKYNDQTLKEVQRKINELMQKVTISAEDKILKLLHIIIDSILRTNYFLGKEFMSFKINSSLIPNIPLPKLYAEIFVYNVNYEGIHLRGGKVARGGIRWSDRLDDYRTEVLGLVKAQIAKNSVIVPTGSKGGFVVKKDKDLFDSREEYFEYGVYSYQNFLRGLLDITDNIIAGDIVPAKNIVRRDNDDPYLVVAADKGTATFSDYANKISAEYNFWLGDAFASGGSAGYDHKKMGITAKGGWISVKRHFAEMGIDTQSQDFTVVGIGDMAGDVFGNGMLLSEHIRLIAAFNHMHIFVDPNPVAKESFKERKRLFELPRSTWLDYNKTLISSGGGIFERTAKEIAISPEMKISFDITEDVLSPEELIQKILLSKCDLLWNGGIGTYIKASTETHDMVGDKSNDMLRVNGADLRCLVVGEGGNLGCTQKGRMEFALNGGRINTDAIDNSAGVDCSDHEVNIKIAFRKALESNKIDIPQRDKILEDMTGEVAELVLNDNFLQTQTISVTEHQAQKLLNLHSVLLDDLEDQGILDRKVEFLPSREEMKKRISAKLGLTRPEIAVLLSYSKIAVYNDIINSNVSNEKYFEKELLSYFPKNMQENFKEEILNHPLKKEIICTIMTNKIVNRMGSIFFNNTVKDTGNMGCDVVRAFTIVNDILGLDDIFAEIDALDNKLSMEVKVDVFSKINKVVEFLILWLLRTMPNPLDLNNIIKDFKTKSEEIMLSVEQLFDQITKERFDNNYKNYKDAGFSDFFAKRIGAASSLYYIFDIVFLSNKSGHTISEVAKIYFSLGSKLKLNILHKMTRTIEVEGYWQNLALKTLNADLYDKRRNITYNILTKEKTIESWMINNNKQISEVKSFVDNILSGDNTDLSMMVVTVKKFDSILGA